jgi:hypothetical protein
MKWSDLILLNVFACIFCSLDQRLAASVSVCGAATGAFNVLLVIKNRPKIYISFQIALLLLVSVYVSVGLAFWAIVGLLSWLFFWPKSKFSP